MDEQSLTLQEAKKLRDTPLAPILKAQVGQHFPGDNLLEVLISVSAACTRKSHTEQGDRDNAALVNHACKALAVMAKAEKITVIGSTAFTEKNEMIARVATIDRAHVAGIMKKFAAIFGETPADSHGVIPVAGLNQLTQAFLSSLNTPVRGAGEPEARL